MFEFSEYPKVSLIYFIRFGFIWTASAISAPYLYWVSIPIQMFVPLFLVWRSSWHKEIYWVMNNAASSSPVLFYCLFLDPFLTLNILKKFHFICQWHCLPTWVYSSLMDINLIHVGHPHIYFHEFVPLFLSLIHIFQKSAFTGDLS